MKESIMRSLTFSALIVAGCLAIPAVVGAQAPPGPLRPPQSSPPAQPPAPTTKPTTPAAPAKDETPAKTEKPLPPREKHDLSGRWKLNRDESDDPTDKLGQSRGSQGGGNRGGSPRQAGGYPGGGGWPGGGGGYPGGGRNRGGVGGESDADYQKMLDAVRPAGSLTVAQTSSEIDLTDEQSRKRTFYTDGRKLQKSKDLRNLEYSAKWEEDRLVSEEKGPNGAKITRTIEVDSEGKYLYETIHVDNGRSGNSAYLRYVYDIVRDDKQ